MTSFYVRGITAAVFAFAAGQMAHADLSAQDVWADWKTYLTSAGYEIAATENTAGSDLTVSDLSLAMKLPDDSGAFKIELSEIVFSGNSDGTVAVSMPDSIPMQFAGTDPDGSQFDARLDYAQNGNSMTVSGSPEDMTYDYKASSVEVKLDSLTVDGATMPPEAVKVSVTLGNVASTTQMKIAGMRDYTQSMNADELAYDIAFKEPGSDNNGMFKGNLKGLGFSGSGSIPLDMNPQDIQAMMKDGFAFSGAFDYASGNSEVKGVDGDDNFAAQSSSQGGRIAVAMDAKQLSYDVSQTAATISVTTSQLPFPVSMDMAEALVRLKFPVAKSEEEQDFGFSIKIGDFTMSDMIWSIFDSGSVLPRDPATIALDVAGKARVLVDFFDPEATENLDRMSTAPGELNALTINELLVSAVGSKLSGTGEFTFDNTDLATFDGMPAPTGEANLQLIGANGLLDKLIEMGIMSDQDAMGARMMMGLLAVPGEGEDSLKSKIEINDQGHIMANGQRIK